MHNGCDLLRINYLCGRITNAKRTHARTRVVVICSELTTFAVESPTEKRYRDTEEGCDLLRINYLCGRITNCACRICSRERVVICSELTTFAVESPTLYLSLFFFCSCDLLRINYLCGRITNCIFSSVFSSSL